MKLDELYFGVKLFPMSYTGREDRRRLKTYNLFDFGRVKWSVARYVTMSDEERSLLNNELLFCFGDTWSRTEFEFMACPWPYRDTDTIENSGIKVDTFSLYVEPNAEYLMSLVKQVDKNSAKKYLSAWKQQRSKK